MCSCSKSNCGCSIVSTTKGEKGDASGPLSLGYKVYRALLTQEGTADPVATILKNTLGPITWHIDNNGVYSGILTGALDESKCFYDITPNDNSANSSFLISLFNGTPNFISIETRASGSLSNDMLYLTPVEILVYP